MRLSVLLLVVFLAPLSAAKASDTWTPDLAGLAAVPQVNLPASVVQKSLAIAAQHKGLPLQFAVPVALQLGLGDGLWDAPDAATARWRLKLHSPGAYSLHVHFGQLRLPPGAELRFYDALGQLVQGPLTRAGETADGQLATALVLGDTAALELRVPLSRREQVRLGIVKVFHGYTDIRHPGKAGSVAKAGACENDVACSQGNAWREQIRSAVLLQIGQFLCSGQLINNTRLDETPFLLTANHCGITSANASTVVAYFNYQRPSCGSGSGSLNQASSGTLFRRSDTNSDSTLVTLITNPPAAYGVYYSGWDASGEDVNSGAGIHHPQGDEKSISLFESPARKIENACSAQDESGSCVMTVDAWEVGWTSGVTEQGSSGSGLWNQNRRLVGVLSGGSSNCSGSNGNGGTDFYGRMDAAWNAGGLKADLDPDNTGEVVLDGKCAGGTPGCAGGPQAAAATASEAKNARFGGSFGWLLSLPSLIAALTRRRR